MSDRRRILDSELYAHFVTFSCFRRHQALEEDHPKRIVLGTLNVQLRRQEATCCGFVVMPEHVHVVVWFPQPQQLSRFMHDWKRESSRTLLEWYRERRPRHYAAAGLAGRFWQAKYYPFEVYTQAKLHEKVDDMHKNPVERGLVERRASQKPCPPSSTLEIASTVGADRSGPPAGGACLERPGRVPGAPAQTASQRCWSATHARFRFR